ncbi:hypothetical protein [Microbacterium sp. 16-032]|jgi:hypothetical protein|uniref:hypothetical protein n=1 Tax=Microbacterium sp. 16-032 TaxID=3239808 RepID=UPI0034E1F828
MRPIRSRAPLAAAWYLEEPGHYVLTVGGSVLGHVIEAPDATFISFDAQAKPIARHDTLTDAQTQTSHLAGGGVAGSRGIPAKTLALTVAGSLLMGLLVAGSVLSR